MIDNHDPDMCAVIFSTFVKNNTYWCPTHVVRKKTAFANYDVFRNDPRLKYLPLLMRLDWFDEMNERASRPKEYHDISMDYYLTGLQTIYAAYQAGVKFEWALTRPLK